MVDDENGTSDCYYYYYFLPIWFVSLVETHPVNSLHLIHETPTIPSGPSCGSAPMPLWFYANHSIQENNHRIYTSNSISIRKAINAQERRRFALGNQPPKERRTKTNNSKRAKGRNTYSLWYILPIWLSTRHWIPDPRSPPKQSSPVVSLQSSALQCGDQADPLGQKFQSPIGRLGLPPPRRS